MTTRRDGRSGSAAALSVGGGGPAEVLFDDDRTRVSRVWLDGGPGTVICKEPRGADAAYRIRAETAVLRRLAGVAGVPRLATVAMAGAGA
jgi:hypothetical protein